MLAFIADHPDDTALVMYHPWWTSPADVFYQHNIEDNTERTLYYGIQRVPFVWADGVIEPIWFYTYERIQAAYDARKAVPTSVSLEIGGSYDSHSDLVEVRIEVSSDSPMPAGDFRLHLVLTESELYHPANNGLEYHHHTMREMIPDYDGTPIVFEGDIPPTVDVAVSFTLDPLYAPENCRLVSFVQDYQSREIHQAGVVMLTDLDEPTPILGESSWSRIKAAYQRP